MRRGTLFVTTNYLCYEAGSLLDLLWRQQKRLAVPITSITHLKKVIEIQVLDPELIVSDQFCLGVAHMSPSSMCFR